MPQKKMGRPPIENPLKKRIQIRVDRETEIKLDECAESLKKSKSDVIRQGIDMVHETLK